MDGTKRITTNNLDDLTDAYEWVRVRTWETAVEESAGMKKPLAFIVDGNPRKPVESVRLWGKVQVVSAGDTSVILEAARAAYEFMDIAAAKHRKSGLHIQSFEWSMDRKLIGARPPSTLDKPRSLTVANVSGVRANVLEAWFLPDGIVWGAFNMLKRAYGPRISLRYFYTQSGPALTIGPPTRKMKGSKRPGYYSKRLHGAGTAKSRLAKRRR